MKGHYTYPPDVITCVWDQGSLCLVSEPHLQLPKAVQTAHAQEPPPETLGPLGKGSHMHLASWRFCSKSNFARSNQENLACKKVIITRLINFAQCKLLNLPHIIINYFK